MSKQKIQMKYHPAKKEISFRRFVGGKEVVILNDSRLCKYMDNNGKFVIQDCGNSFLKDIAETFDGEKSIEIEVITTKNDFEDLVQMIEYYNQDSNIKITATLLSELPDMNDTYRVVREHGEKSIVILKKHQADFFNVSLDNASVKHCVNLFSAEVQREVDNIRLKIDSMSDNTINLCFAGVYSTGKSALINAILGFKILPEDIKSETARMFIIQSPRPGENVRIFFNIREDSAELMWNDKSNVFEFYTGPSENNTRKSIQEVININKSKPQHTQTYEVLKALNTNDEVGSAIKVFFPIPLDTEMVQFRIYDTPGTDSNFGEHQIVLQEALSEQTHSILIFVVAPDKVEGEGNNTLLSYLKEADNENRKTNIDIGRSLFVINKADTVDADARKALQTAKITKKDDDGFSIKLADKKLFFVSAWYAYSAKAIANKIATSDDIYRIEDDYNKIYRPERGRYYQYNRIATSEYATQELIGRSESKLINAEKNQNKSDVFHVCAGLYALESEIITYGEKYAAAVRAFAIIDSVDKALGAMNKNARSLERQNQEDISKINQEINELRKIIFDSIKKAYDNYEIPKNEPLPIGLIKRIQLDSSYIEANVTGVALSFIERLLKGWFFGLGKVKFKQSNKNEITQNITSVLNDYTTTFLKRRRLELEKIRDAFIADVKKAIFENGNISEAAKNYVSEIRPPEIKKFKNFMEFGDMYDSKKRAGKFLCGEHLDKEGFMEDADRRLTEIATSMATDFEKDFRTTLTSVLSSIGSEFTQNTETYSILMQAKLEDKKVMEQLREKIALAAGALSRHQEDLNTVIWSVKNND